ncbi:unnamed protein product (macronuclear) [Paramecium tetraurelia]|uniref:RING-type domain-containing protein n=1 Tax=Paramecium tetraurelia TaxID=5888 RepID=A0D0N1_PARTE|nr:uncharacterized protein GSPATT00012150001 [Paramecium tetraurelia]CAK76598.1 unnamed protein product [Paramecium tetraurelia]|eukprot:XP_001443995.1 hypothetical protein (macronuclear) [Paramecium tetraurelia strain d4-2]
MNNLDQSIQSEFNEFTAQFQQQEQVINNPESLSFQNKSEQVYQNQSIQFQSAEQLQSYQQSFNNFQDFPQVELLATSQNETEQYLNISFQDIIQLLFNNQCPQLNNVLKTVIFRSCVIINVFTILNLIFIINEVIALYFSLITKDDIRELFSVYFGFNLISDCLVIYINCQLRYVINEAEQIKHGDITHPIIEYLKYTIKLNSPFEDIMEDEEQNSQAQQVAISISEKISTSKWISYLLESQNSQIFALNRVCVLVKIILFAWGNITIIQWAILNWNGKMKSMDQFEPILIILTLVSMLIGYMVIAMIICILLIICASIPILIGVAIWQSCSWCTDLYYEYKQQRIEQQRMGFLENLNSQKFQDLKNQDTNIHEECSICLQTYQIDDNCVRLPCNVDGGNKKINHIFHDECIRIWIQDQGSCPICRTIFIERLED